VHSEQWTFGPVLERKVDWKSSLGSTKLLNGLRTLICESSGLILVTDDRTAFYENQQNQQTIESPAVKTIDFPKVAKPPFTLAESFANSPRRSHLAKAGGDTLPTGKLFRVLEHFQQD